MLYIKRPDRIKDAHAKIASWGLDLMDSTDRAIHEIWTQYGDMVTRQLQDILDSEYGISLGERAIQYRMKKLGLKPIGKPFGQGTRIFCQDGHIVSSYEEARVDEWLAELEIDHWVHHRIQGTPYFIDFWLPEYKAGIEVLGVVGNPTYNKRTQEKRTVYQLLNIPVVFITPGEHLDSGIIARLARTIRKSSEQKAKDLKVLRGY